MPNTPQKNVKETCRAGKRALDQDQQDVVNLWATLHEKVAEIPDQSAILSKLVAYIEKQKKAKKEITEAANASKSENDLPWPKSYSRNKQVGNDFIVFLLISLGWKESIVETLSPDARRQVFYALFGDEEVFLPHSLRGRSAALGVTWYEAAERFSLMVGNGLFPKDTSGKRIAWANVPTRADDVNWDAVGFYKWECNQRKLSCGNGELQVILTESHIGSDASRVHLMNNVAYDTATLGIPGLKSGQIACREIFNNHTDANIRLAFMELIVIMDDKFPKTPEKKKGGSCRAAEAGRGMPLALLGASAATSSSALPALEDVANGEMAACKEKNSGGENEEIQMADL